jgi:hypothetical protein
VWLAPLVLLALHGRLAEGRSALRWLVAAVLVLFGNSALILCLVLGKRLGFGREAMPPHNMVLCMVGTGMLWVGWYGFNAGSALAADGVSANAFMTTTLAAATAGFVWGLVEKILKGQASILGICSGVVAGLVVITPACGFVNATGAVIIGVLAAIVPYVFAMQVKKAVGYDDADALVEELIRVHSAPRKLVVVSSDRHIQRMAKRRRAIAVDSEAWYDQVCHQRKSQPRPETADDTKPVVSFTDAETADWLQVFGDTALTPQTPHSVGRPPATDSPQDKPSVTDPELFNPFPPGYAEDLPKDE